MPRFNILRALAGAHANNDQNHYKGIEKPGSEQGDKDILNTRQLPSRKTRTLTKRKPMGGREQSQPSYSVLTEDIGHHELGRYPKATPDSMPTQSNPPQYADDHPQFEGTRLEYPTMTHGSFHPMSQSSKRWSPVPYVYREPVTEQYDDDGTTEHDSSHHESPHIQEPPRHTPPQDARRPQARKRIEGVGHNGIPVSLDAPGSPSRHEGRENMAQNAHLEDRHNIRYIHDGTMNSNFPHQSSPMLSPADLTGRERSLNDTTHTREESVQGSDIIEPVIFEHEVLRNDGAPNPKIWHYIVPGGLDVVFKDEDGNELTSRIKNVGDGSRRRVTPMVIEDEFGNEIYRTGHFDSLSSSSRFDPGRRQKEYPYESRYQKSTQQPGIPGSEPVVRAPVWVQRRSGSPTRHVYTSYLSPKAEKVILIDEHGRQIPIADRRKRSSTRQAKQTQDE